MDRQQVIDHILDHAEHPRGKGRLDDAQIKQAGGNPGCGDVIVWMLQVGGGDRIEACAWQGQGCNLSQAGASILSERLVGMTLQDVLDLPPNLLIELLGPQIALTRPTCSSLALNTAKTGIHRFLLERAE